MVTSPARSGDGVEIRDQLHVGLGPLVFDVHINVIAINRLEKDRWQREHAFIAVELLAGHGFATRNAGDITDDALIFFNPPRV